MDTSCSATIRTGCTVGENIPIMELAYMAGYFDGEGCICLLNHGTGCARQLRIALVSRDFASLVSFGRWFGGKLRTHRQTYGKSTRLYWAWYKTNAEAQSVLKVLTPLLRGKRRKAEAVLELSFIGRKKPRNTWLPERLRREEVHRTCR